MVKRVQFTGSGSDNTKLKSILDEMTIADNEAQRAHRKGKKRSLYASDFGQCLRKCWYGFFPVNYPTADLDPRVLRIFHNGESVHDRLGRYLKRSDIYFEEEVDVPRDDLEVHGRCDGICAVDGKAIVVEFKSINRKSVFVPKEEHIGQTIWYMAMWRKLRYELKKDFGYALDEDVSPDDLAEVISDSGRVLEDLDAHEQWLMFTTGEIEGEIIYESKQTQQTDHFTVEWNQGRADKVREWFEQLKWHVDNVAVPEVNYDRSRFPCSWGVGSSAGKCPYYKYCWKSDS